MERAAGVKHKEAREENQGQLLLLLEGARAGKGWVQLLGPRSVLSTHTRGASGQFLRVSEAR